MTGKKVWEKNPFIAVNVLFVKKWYISCLDFKTQLNHEKHIVVSMIPNGKGWFYHKVKKLSAILRRITSKRLKQKTNLNPIKKYVKIKIFWCCNSF